MTSTQVLGDLASALASGAVEVVDLTAPLGPETPLIKLPPEIGKNTPPIEIHAISHYDKDGPFWAWNWLKLGEHSGTHFDAPMHWITGKDYTDGSTDTHPGEEFRRAGQRDRLLGRGREEPRFPADRRRRQGLGEDARRHPGRCWVLMRTDWYKRNDSEANFLNADDNGPHSPGPTAETIHYLIAKGVIGWGSETVGTDAGSAGGMDPPFPAHTFMHKANRYGLASLCHLDKLPPKGAILIAAPLKIVKGTGSPLRVLALVPKK